MQNVQKLLPDSQGSKSRFQGRIIAGTDIEVIGKGNVGEKAGELIRKTEILRSVGLRTPRRVVFASDFFEDTLSQAALSETLRDSDLEYRKKIFDSGLAGEQLEIFKRVFESFGGADLIIRSSGEGDSRGTGTYESIRPYPKDFQHSHEALLAVLASYFSKSAIEFRKDANLAQGFGIIVEPLIGQLLTYGWYGGLTAPEYTDQSFEPVLSGFGYTSTVREGPYLSVVPGFGGGVESTDGAKITKRDIAKFGGDLNKYFDKEVGRYMRDRDFAHRPVLFDSQRSPYYKLVGRERDLLLKVNLTGFYDMLGKVEDAFGKPQYIEWVMTLGDSGPEFWITQIAEVSKNLDVVDFSDVGRIVISGKEVTGTGIRECKDIFECLNPWDIVGLHEFNKSHENYILVFTSRATTSTLDCRKLTYADYSNASVLIEIGDALHANGTVVSHLGGQAAVTGKLVAAMDWRSSNLDSLDAFGTVYKMGEGRVYSGKFRVAAGEMQNKLIVGVLE